MQAEFHFQVWWLFCPPVVSWHKRSVFLLTSRSVLFIEARLLLFIIGSSSEQLILRNTKNIPSFGLNWKGGTNPLWGHFVLEIFFFNHQVWNIFSRWWIASLLWSGVFAGIKSSLSVVIEVKFCLFSEAVITAFLFSCIYGLIASLALVHSLSVDMSSSKVLCVNCFGLFCKKALNRFRCLLS